MFPIWNCLVCSNLTTSKHVLFCPPCQRELRSILNSRENAVKSCGGIRLSTLGGYEGTWAKWIKNMKRRPRGFILNEEREFINLLVEYYFKPQDFNSIDGIVAVPSHPGRTLFETDLSARFASALSRRLKKPVNSLLGMSFKWMLSGGSAQKDRAKNERWQLLGEKKFKVVAPSSSVKKVLLVDDISTTGATLMSANFSLKQKGITCEEAVVLASVY